MNRLDRRMRLLRGRQHVAFDPEQLKVEAAPRERAARLARGALATERPVVVRHARWSAVRWWMDDLATDLRVADRPWNAVVVDMAKVSKPDEAWMRVPAALAQALGVTAAHRATIAASREAFRESTGMVLRKARARRHRKVLLCLNADALGYALLEDLCASWTAAVSEMTPGTSPMLVLSCQIGGQSLPLPHAVSFLLPDPTRDEAIRLAAELLGADDPARLAQLVDVLGPVPDFLLAAVRAGAPRDPRRLPEALGPLYRELAEAIDIVSATDALAARLEVLVKGPQPFQRQEDNALWRSGLVSVRGRSGVRQTSLRSPLMTSLM